MTPQQQKRYKVICDQSLLEKEQKELQRLNQNGKKIKQETLKNWN